MTENGADLILPDPDQIEEVLEMLVGKSITVNRLTTPINNLSSGTYSVYDFEDGETGAVVYCSLGLSNALGAAIMMIPAGAAEDATDEGEIPKNLFDNFSEVANVMTSLMNDKRAHAKRVLLESVYVDFAELPDPAREVFEKASRVASFKVGISGGYPGGDIKFACR